ncbi:Phosphoserine aminotransferase [Weeksella virosa]|uniref:Phosphoserine aminotransferase n=2 Tax=Weeksella virosa TaxID=1014 RepID=F0NYL6_WEEVC|nr:Phosphoserine aminotransferase [Weeksella virosa DSM 16922]SUP53407.1 Phosphoserine aminotransferase [Weeksella virosa]VEH63127.1 Phosphoserine aminotransferase [Weeksella virosa]
MKAFFYIQTFLVQNRSNRAIRICIFDTTLTIRKYPTMKIHNFSAGPCILPQVVFDKMAEACINFNHSGSSILEISHRRKDAVEVIDTARALVKELMQVPDSHEVVFMQGGASLQFPVVAYNLLREGGKASYLQTGKWAENAIKEAKRFGEIEIIASSKDKNYSYIPKKYTVFNDVDYFHCTSNNTIYGTQMKEFPSVEVPIVCDMSSDILSREIEVDRFGLIYAGAQKNMGPAGSAVAIVQKDLLGKTGRNIPDYLNYATHIAKESSFNTWPVIAIYGVMLNLQWLKEQGGVAAIAKINTQKAETIYAEIDRNSMFEGTAVAEDRSQMNATFVLKQENLKTDFDALLKEAGIASLAGHRDVGGYRASMYNALPLESVQVLVEVMKNFEQKFG